jgi:DamX protein
MGLHRDPFAADRDLFFYYAADAFEQRVALLKRLQEGSDVLILVLGESGSGKTTLLKRFLDSLDAPWRTGRIRARTKPSASLKGLDQHPIYIVKDPREPVILFDDAHRLSRTQLRYLLQDVLASGRSKKIKRLVLFGDPALAAAITAMSDDLMGEAAVNKIFIPALSLEESGDYLRHRLFMAGYAGKDPFNSKTLHRLHRRSGGIPGKLNTVADSWLEKNGAPSPSGIRSLLRGATFKWFWGASAAVFVMLLGAFLLRSVPPSPSPTLSAGNSPGKIIRAKIADSEAAGTPLAGGPLRTISKMAEVEPTGSEPPARQDRGSGPAETSQTTAALTTSPAAGESERPAAAVLEPAGRKESPARQEWALQREAWLMTRNPGHYTIQILGVRTEASLRRFVAEHPPLKKHAMAYYQTRFQGDPWYPLLCGVYPTQTEARTAIQRLPENIRRSSPWIRKLSSIQRTIRNHRP